MHLFNLCIIMVGLHCLLPVAQADSPDSLKTCRKAFMYNVDDFDVANTINICLIGMIPVGYESTLNMPVCDDKLCANVVLKINWDLAGNYVSFDTITGKPLTKFDHKRFTDTDYQRLNQILKDRNSILRTLEKNDLVDKSIQLKATTVDAVTGATPSTIKKAVVEGAVYSSYTLWHLIYGFIGDSMRANTRRIYSDLIAQQLLKSSNFETQLFALKQWSKASFETHSDLLFQVIRQSVPLIRASVINKMPLPFPNEEKNQKFVSLFPELDAYSKGIFLDRITESKPIAEVFLPLMNSKLSDLDQNQRKKYLSALKKFEIPDTPELLKQLEKNKK